MKITAYSAYDNYTVKSETENISNVIDKMVRLTAKVTESYAGDIVYDMNALCASVAQKCSHDKILFFREDGVSSFNTEFVKMNDISLFCSDYLQTWHLTYDKDTGVTMLKRVRLRKE